MKNSQHCRQRKVMSFPARCVSSRSGDPHAGHFNGSSGSCPHENGMASVAASARPFGPGRLRNHLRGEMSAFRSFRRVLDGEPTATAQLRDGIIDLDWPVPRTPTTVLVVEDDPVTRDFYRQALMAAGYTVVAVEDGIDALQRTESDLPDVVVLDLHLPRLAGRDVYQELRAHPETRNIPIIVVTGTDADLEPAISHILRKPVHPERLVAAVDE